MSLEIPKCIAYMAKDKGKSYDVIADFIKNLLNMHQKVSRNLPHWQEHTRTWQQTAFSESDWELPNWGPLHFQSWREKITTCGTCNYCISLVHQL